MTPRPCLASRWLRLVQGQPAACRGAVDSDPGAPFLYRISSFISSRLRFFLPTDFPQDPPDPHMRSEAFLGEEREHGPRTQQIPFFLGWNHLQLLPDSGCSLATSNTLFEKFCPAFLIPITNMRLRLTQLLWIAGRQNFNKSIALFIYLFCIVFGPRCF